jgi:hypothetical protein
MNRKSLFFAFLALVLAMLACQMGESGPSAEQIAETMIAQTAAAASPTPLPPTETPIPPTETATATATPPPTATATITPTPTPSGPIVFNDDFAATNLKNWKGCTKCDWKDGVLLMGPYKARGDGYSQSDTAICVPCGKPTFYRMAVDVTFVEGYTDRFYGLLVGDGKRYQTSVGISPLQVTAIFRYDYQKREWELLNPSTEKVFSRLVKPGKLTNRIEVLLEPSGVSDGQLTLKINGSVSYVVYNLPVEPAEVGLYLDWHSIGVAYDNFEFEEILP